MKTILSRLSVCRVAGRCDLQLGIPASSGSLGCSLPAPQDPHASVFTKLDAFELMCVHKLHLKSVSAARLVCFLGWSWGAGGL